MAEQKPFWKNWEFIAAQGCMIIATIGGVYIGAREGLNAAVEFQLIESDRTSYYQQTALAHELRTNTDELQEFIDLWQEPNTIVVKGYLPEFETFIWRSSAESDSTFEIPPRLLIGMQEFHREVPRIIEARLNKTTSRAKMMETLLAQQENAKATLAGLDQNRAMLRKRLDNAGVEIE